MPANSNGVPTPKHTKAQGSTPPGSAWWCCGCRLPGSLAPGNGKMAARHGTATHGDHRLLEALLHSRLPYLLEIQAGPSPLDHPRTIYECFECFKCFERWILPDLLLQKLSSCSQPRRLLAGIQYLCPASPTDNKASQKPAVLASGTDSFSRSMEKTLGPVQHKQFACPVEFEQTCTAHCALLTTWLLSCAPQNFKTCFVSERWRNAKRRHM